MPTFTGGYVEPGVYVKIEDVVLPALPPGALVAALTGTGKTDKRILNETVTIDPDTKEGTLKNKPVLHLERNIAGQEFVLGPDGTEYIANTDFTYVAATGVITWIGSSVPEKVIVTYYVNKVYPEDYSPKIFSNLQQVINEYGNIELDDEGAPKYTLPIGARIYFENGGGLLVCCQIYIPEGEEEDEQKHMDAIDKLKNVDVYCIVPLIDTNEGSFISYVKAHVNQMSSTIEKRERIAILGGPVANDNILDPESSTNDYVNRLKSIQASRIASLIPSGVKKTFNIGQIVLPGPYIGCAVAGVVCNPAYTSGEPISGKDLVGFDSIEDIYTRYQKNRMAAAGGMIIEQSNGRIYIRHALSTDTSTIVASELKITRIKDVISKLMRTSLERMFINTRYVGPETLEAIKGVCRLLLDGVVSLRDIVSYENLTVVQNPIDPRQIDISFQIRPSWDINWILVTFGVSI